jgi:hypothetical protein
VTFNIRQSVFDRDGEIREEAADRYRDQLMELFAASPEAEALGAEDFPFGWAATLIDYGISYLGETPATMTPADLHELLLDIFPRKVMAERGGQGITVLAHALPIDCGQGQAGGDVEEHGTDGEHPWTLERNGLLRGRG